MKTRGLGVFLELRRRLLSGLLVVGTDVARSPADVAVAGGDSSLLVRTPRGELSLTLPAGVAFVTGSCIHTPLGESSGAELHFRLRITTERSKRGNVQDGRRRAARPASAEFLH